MSDELRILLLEDVASDAELVQRALRKAGLTFQAQCVATRAGFEQALEVFKPDIVLCDYHLPSFNGGEALQIVRRAHPQVPLIIVTGALGDEAAVDLVNQGAKDYVLKSNLVRLAPAVRRAIAVEMGVRARKAAEAEVRIAEEKYRALFVAARDGIVLIDETGRIMHCNPEFERQTGRSLEQLMQTRIWELSAVDQRALAEAKFRATWDAGTGEEYDLTFAQPDGAIVPVEFRTTTLTLGDQRYLQSISRDITERALAAAAQQRAAAELRQVLEQTIAALALTLEKRDPYAAGHQQRVARLASAIATELGLPRERVQGLHFGALLHNIGTIGVPAEILNRPGKLSELQFALIKLHPQTGFEILKDISFPWPVAQLVLQHHERLDGSGYPHSLQGEQIFLEARILAVADVLTALLAHRPYRAAMSLEAALTTLAQGRGSQFDPAVVDACLRVVQPPVAPATRSDEQASGEAS